jgi:RNA recognition motif-containing protein
MGRRLYVGNLAYGVTEAELRESFAEAGDVVDVKVVLDRDTGRPRGFAFVELSNDGEAARAIEVLNGRELQGRAMNVSEARERTGGGGGGGGGGGFRGGGGGGGYGGGGGGGDYGGGGGGGGRDRRGGGGGGGGRGRW